MNIQELIVVLNGVDDELRRLREQVEWFHDLCVKRGEKLDAAAALAWRWTRPDSWQSFDYGQQLREALGMPAVGRSGPLPYQATSFPTKTANETEGITKKINHHGEDQ